MAEKTEYSGAAAPPPARRDRKRHIAVGLLGFVLSGIGLYWVLSDIDFDKLLASFGRIQMLPLVGSLIVYWCGAGVIRALLVRRLLQPMGHVSAGKAYRYICIGLMANNILPLRMGELVRVGGIANVSKMNIASVTGGLAVERVLDLLMASMVGIAAVQLAPVLPEYVRIVVLVAGCGLGAAFLVLAYIARHKLNEIEYGQKREVKKVIWNLFVRFASGFNTLGSLKGILTVVAFSALIWSLIVVALMLRLATFDLEPSLSVALVLLTFLSLGISLPSAPGYVGVYHAFVVNALILFGIEVEVAVGFAFVCHIIDVIPATLIGMVCMILEGMGLADLRRNSSTINKNSA